MVPTERSPAPPKVPKNSIKELQLVIDQLTKVIDAQQDRIERLEANFNTLIRGLRKRAQMKKG